MKGSTIKYGNLVVYPEYCGYSLRALHRASVGDERFRIASLCRDNENIAVVLRDGKMVYHRAKHRLHHSEAGLRVGRKPEVIDLGEQKVLILICYEIVFSATKAVVKFDNGVVVDVWKVPKALRVGEIYEVDYRSPYFMKDPYLVVD